MKLVEIPTITHGFAQKALIECDRQNRTLTMLLEKGSRKTYVANDLYECLGLLRADLPETKFLCKGSKLNVHPSRMSSQMSAGIVAYELILEVPSEPDDVVNIFDFEDVDITNDIKQQRDFYIRWLDSLNRQQD
jgi:hypothetical protein